MSSDTVMLLQVLTHRRHIELVWLKTPSSGSTILPHFRQVKGKIELGNDVDLTGWICFECALESLSVCKKILVDESADDEALTYELFKAIKEHGCGGKECEWGKPKEGDAGSTEKDFDWSKERETEEWTETFTEWKKEFLEKQKEKEKEKKREEELRFTPEE